MAEINYSTPGNSAQRKPEPPKANKVVTSEVKLKKPSKTEKLKEEAKASFKNVMTNTVAPSIKDMILNAIWSGLSMIFFPDGSHRPTYSNTPASRVSYYNNAYNRYGSGYYDRNQPKATVNVAEPAFRNPLMGSIQDANAVIDAMRDTIRQYGFATWSTLYDLCGMDSANWQGTTKYGWTSIESTTISTVHTADGQLAFELRMPKACPIDDMPF